MSNLLRGRKKQTNAFEQVQNIYDNKFGYDILTIEYPQQKYLGIVSYSPIEKRLMDNFDYRRHEFEHRKPFKAHWIIKENKLFLMYVNAIIGDKIYNTTDIVPEFSENSLFFHYIAFTGILEFAVHFHEEDGFKNEYVNCEKEYYKLNLINGILENQEIQKIKF